MEIDAHSSRGSLLRRLIEVERLMLRISYQQETIMATMQNIIDDVAAEKTVIDSLVVFVQGLHDQIKALGTGVTQAQIDAVFAGVEANKAEITVAMAPLPVV